MDTEHFIRTYEAAAANEYAAWLEVRDMQLDSADFDEQAWKRWADAAGMRTAAAELPAAVMLG